MFNSVSAHFASFIPVVTAWFVSALDKIFENWLVLATVLIPGYRAWRNLKIEIEASGKASLQMFNLQKKKEDVEANIPVAIELLEDLAALQQAFIHRGRFIPGLEHRCPTIQLKDGERDDEKSIAARTHQLYVIALRIIRNSRKIIFLTPEGMMPKTVIVCRKIRDALQSKTPGQKRYFELNIGNIATILQRDLRPGSQEQMREENQCDQFATELENFQMDFEFRVQEEFPTYAKEERRK